MEETIMEKMVMKQLSIVGLVLTLAACQTTIVPPNNSEVIQREGVTEILPLSRNNVAVPEAEPICLVRARFFRGMIGVPCSKIAQQISP